ncbi:pilus assembly protein N-terminal domain-containing protein [Botrimarina sp.]|uniref:type II and III secretion system protein family protein n=1 Tax=Botrimarina sp. TaxID=2795802 RepID=UPI0032EC8843
MYDSISRRSVRAARRATALVLSALVAIPPSASAQTGGGSVVRKIDGPSDQIEITTNSSRILTLEKKIPKVQVNNPELLAVTPLSANEIQISAKKAGVTQVNLWDENGDLHTVDVYIYGDVRELEHALATQFPNSSIKVYRYSQSLVLTGFIDRPDYVDPIVRLAEDYAPKVINNIAVGGVQQVLLKVKIYEVSRSKLRKLSTDFAFIGDGGYFGTSVSGLINNVGGPSNPFGFVTLAGDVKGVADTAGQTVEFAVTDGTDALVGFLDALQQKDVAKILAEPNIVAVSGRPAQFNEGGEIPIIVPQSLGNVAIEYKPFGTQVDFLPIVLGNGKIRLEVRPRVSDLDFSNAVIINNTQVPALTVRQVDTAVEMSAGQTFAIAGLIQQRTTSTQRGVPFLMDIPILGVPFRSNSNEVEEVELLILVTPEFVDAMEPHQVPPCGPGMGTVSPSDCDLYIDGKIETPDYCSPCANGRCGGCPQCNAGGFPGPPSQLLNGGARRGGYGPAATPTPAGPPMEYLPAPESMGPGEGVPADVQPLDLSRAAPPTGEAGQAAESAPGPSHFGAEPPRGYVRQAARPYQATPAVATDEGLIGPVGYED